MESKIEKSTFTKLLVIILGDFLVPFTTMSINLALPLINKELSLTATTSVWVPTIYLLSTAIFQIPCARIGDIFGRRRVYTLGLFSVALFSILSCFAWSGGSLLIFRFLCGIGSAMMFGTNLAILTSVIPTKQRGWAFGIHAAVVYFAAASGPFLGGILIQSFGWRSIFYLVSTLAISLMIATSRFIKEEWRSSSNQRFDWVGSILYAIGLFGIIFGFSSLTKTWGIFLILLGIATLILFALYEKRVAQPVFNVKTFLENRVFRLSSITSLLNYSSTAAIAFILSFYLQYVRGLTPRDAGFILLAQSLIQGIVSLRGGKLSAIIKPRYLTTVGISTLFLGLVGLSLIGAETSYYILILILSFIGLGFGLFTSPNTNILMSSVKEQNYSMASATAGTMRLTGQSISMGVAVMAIAFSIGNVEMSSASSSGILSSMRITFSICAGISLIGVFTSIIRSRAIKN